MQPRQEHAIRALSALTNGRMTDAERLVLAIPGSPLIVQAWKTFLCGTLALKRLDLSESASLSLQAAAMAFTEAMAQDQSSDTESLRLCACALHQAGRVQRRQDRADQAYQTHLAAYHLRKRHGSWEELWETCVELGLDCEVAKRHEDAQRWFRTAIESADNASEEPVRKRAIACTRLSTSLTESSQHQHAADAARQAWRMWREHDPGSVEAAQSNLHVGSALLKYAESAHTTGDGLAKSILAEAVDYLTTASDELSAFGEEFAPDVRSSAEQLGIARRLLGTLAPS